MKKKIIVMFILFIICGCSKYSSHEIPDGYIDKEEHYQQKGFRDYTDYAKYKYETVDIFKSNENYKIVTAEMINEIKKYFDDVYNWLKAENRLDEFVFDSNCINEGDYVRIDNKYKNDNRYIYYTVYFFDIETLTLYYIHNNS